MLGLHRLFYYLFVAFIVAVFATSVFIGYYSYRDGEVGHAKKVIAKAQNEFAKYGEEQEILAEHLSLLGVNLLLFDKNHTPIFSHPEYTHFIFVRGIHLGEYYVDEKSFSLFYKYSVMHKNEECIAVLYAPLGGTKNAYLDLWKKATVIFIFALVFTFALSSVISKILTKQLTSLSKLLGEIPDIDVDREIRGRFLPEFDVLEESIIKLSKKITKKDKKLKKHTAALRLRNRENLEIISAISHEFKNPIAIISGYCETLLEDKELDPKLREKFLKKIENNAKKLTALIDRLSLSTKLENHAIEPAFAKTSLLGICNDVKNTCEDKYKEKKVHIIGKEREVACDKTLLELAITNLVENALKYSFEDVTLKLDEERISVIDKGSGIPEEEIDLITKKFYRADKNSWNSSLGLGLWIVKFILKLHNTNLEIESTKGVGSVFSFKI